jgi:hypothetical protein
LIWSCQISETWVFFVLFCILGSYGNIWQLNKTKSRRVWFHNVLKSTWTHIAPYPSCRGLKPFISP